MRKIQHLLFFLAIVCVTTRVTAQGAMGKISGTVLDQAGKSLPDVSVSLHKATDSALIKIAITTKQGNFEFDPVGDGQYFISITSVGFEKAFVPVFEVKGNVLKLEPTKLTEAPKAMTGVTVVAKRPFVETKIDKTVINVEASPTSAGATALEVLEKSPGVQVSNDGAISLRGKAGVIVMMDGKQTFLSATDLANLLKNMPASSIDQIEIMTNPSAKYDAAGNSGIINIKTKKGQAGGFNGSIMIGATVSIYGQDGNTYLHPRTQNSINFNYRKDKINFFGNYNPNFFRGRNHLEIDRRVQDQDKNLINTTDVDTRFKFGNTNHTLKLGLDYQLNKKSTIGVVASGFTFSGRPRPTTTTRVYDPNGSLRDSMQSFTDNRIEFRNFTSNLNFRHVFDTSGREFTADLDFIVYDNVSKMTLTTDTYDDNGNLQGQLQLKGNLPSSIKIYSAKADYVHPLKSGGRVEAGFKSSYVTNDNVVNYVRWSGSKWVEDDRSNHFIYDEAINALYLNGNKQFGKWSLQGGLRLENTWAKGYQVTNDSTFKRNFTNLFPSAFVSYAVDKKNQLTVSYSRRITRPNYQDLNPFIYFLDSLSYRKGNPFLTPQFTHNIEFSHAFKGKYITTLNYNHTSDFISQIFKPDGDLVFFTSENVAKFRNIGISITTPVTIAPWWNINIFTNVYNNRYKGIYEGRPLNVGFTSFMVNMTQTFTLKKGLTLETSGFYRAKGVEQLTTNYPMYVLNFGAQKTVMKGKGTVRLNLRDPFWIQRYKGHTKYDIVDHWVRNRWDNRQVTASFTYRFGKTSQQNQPPRRRNSASQDEQNRVGGQGN